MRVNLAVLARRPFLSCKYSFADTWFGRMMSLTDKSEFEISYCWNGITTRKYARIASISGALFRCYEVHSTSILEEIPPCLTCRFPSIPPVHDSPTTPAHPHQNSSALPPKTFPRGKHLFREEMAWTSFNMRRKKNTTG